MTGGTGFVGSHAVRAMLDAGHEVRLFARSPAKVADIYGERASELTEVVEGDMVLATITRRDHVDDTHTGTLRIFALSVTVE